jgi:hypothetical protein
VLAERNSSPFQPVPSAGSGQAFSVLLRRKSITWLARLNFSSLSYEKIPALILAHYFAPQALVTTSTPPLVVAFAATQMSDGAFRFKPCW